MNKKMYPLTIILAMWCSYMACHAQMKIVLTNFKTSQGNAVVNLFRENDDIPSKPFMTLSSAIVDDQAQVVIEHADQGDYAAIAYHDQNSNGTLDHKFGFPNEPMGFSNDWHLGLFSGMPTFQKLKFKHDRASTVIVIKIN